MKQRKIKLIILILTIILFNLILPTAYVKAWEIDDEGYVSYIVDGDTFDVESVGRIRLADINCPEIGEPGADEATQFLTSLIYNKDVYIDIDDIYGTGPYGRIIAVVYVYYNDNYLQNVNQALLDAGHAIITDYDNEFNPYTWDSLVEYDSAAPIWEPIPSDQIWELSSYYSYDVDAIDPSGISEYWINDTENFQINENGLISNKKFLLPGNFWISLGAIDPNGNENTSKIQISIEDTSSPLWNPELTDQVWEYSMPFQYDINAFDLSGIGSFWINDTSNFDIDNNGLIENKKILPIGSYWLEIGVKDNYNNEIETNIKIIVQDTISPSWEKPPLDQVINQGSSFLYEVKANDPSGIGSYWINDTSNFRIDNNGTITNVTCLNCGSYWLEIFTNDTYGNTNSELIQIRVDNEVPNKLPKTIFQDFFIIVSLIMISTILTIYSLFILKKFFNEL